MLDFLAEFESMRVDLGNGKTCCTFFYYQVKKIDLALLIPKIYGNK